MKVQHVGIYGLIEEENRLLVVKKARGPYKGLFDLPGGKPLHGEQLLSALQREIQEETGIVAISFSHIANHSLTCTYTNEKGEVCEFYHIAMVYRVEEADFANFSPSITAVDVEGSSWVSKLDLTNQNASLLVLANCST